MGSLWKSYGPMDVRGLPITFLQLKENLVVARFQYSVGAGTVGSPKA